MQTPQRLHAFFITIVIIDVISIIIVTHGGGARAPGDGSSQALRLNTLFFPYNQRHKQEKGRQKGENHRNVTGNTARDPHAAALPSAG